MNQLQPTEVSPSVEIRCSPILNAFQLGKKGSPRKVSVPVGQVIVLNYGGETADAGGLPEVYLAGEIVVRDPLRGDVPCWAVVLAEFPGKGELRLSRPLSAISVSAEDLATFHLRFFICLYDPILLLRRASGGWEKREDQDKFNKGLEEELQAWLEHYLEGRGVQVWSGDENAVLNGIFSALDEKLRGMGLRVDDIALHRHYPARLYEIALQFARAESSIGHSFNEDRKQIAHDTGLSEDALMQITKSKERKGVALHRALVDAPPESRKQAAKWLEGHGLSEMSDHLKKLYSGEYSELDIRLSEQVLLSAIRNPWLTLGERLQELSEMPATRFWEVHSQIESAS